MVSEYEVTTVKNKNDNKDEFNKAENIIVKVGDTRRREGSFLRIKKITPHENAFSEGYNYNIGQ